MVQWSLVPSMRTAERGPSRVANGSQLNGVNYRAGCLVQLPQVCTLNRCEPIVRVDDDVQRHYWLRTDVDICVGR